MNASLLGNPIAAMHRRIELERLRKKNDELTSVKESLIKENMQLRRIAEEPLKVIEEYEREICNLEEEIKAMSNRANEDASEQELTDLCLLEEIDIEDLVDVL